MTRNILVLSLLPLAFVVGCEPIDNVDCVDNDCGDDDGDAEPGEFEATLRSVAPYGWVGNHVSAQIDEHYTGKTPDCENVNECSRLVDEWGGYWISLYGDTWDCVNQTVQVTELDDDETVQVSDDAWLGEGICGLAPDGDYGTYDVSTDVGDQVWINFGSGIYAPITGSDFFYEDDERLLEGSVSEDLMEIDYHRVVYNDDGSVFNEWEGTLTLQD